MWRRSKGFGVEEESAFLDLVGRKWGNGVDKVSLISYGMDKVSLIILE